MTSARSEPSRTRREIAGQVRTNPWKGYFADGATTGPAVWISGFLLLACELAYVVGPRSMPRSGLEKWFDWSIAHAHLNQILVLPVLTFGILLAWHYRCGGSWRVKPKSMLALVAESVSLGLVLAMTVRAIRLLTCFGSIENELAWTFASRVEIAIPSLVAAVSASVHEEVFFRLGMLGGGVAIARRLGICGPLVQAGLVILVSLTFAAIHYSTLNPAGEPIDIAGFSCRFGVGMAFGTIWLTRGLALAIGIHCVYNIMSLF